MKRGVLAVALSLLALSLASNGEKPLDPLRYDGSETGRYTLAGSAEYVPRGAEGFGVDETGFPYDFVRVDHCWSLLFSGSLSLGRSWITGFDLAGVRTVSEEMRRYPDGTESRVFRDIPDTFDYTLWHECRIEPGIRGDPRVRFSVGRSRILEISLSGNLLMDPMVLAGSVGYGIRSEDFSRWFALRAAVGFVANARISLSLSTLLHVPSAPVGPPNATIALSVRYLRDADASEELSACLNVSVRSEATLVGLAFGLSFAGPRPSG